jgi:uncharacterized protein (TIGR00299 family) protein
VNQHGITGTHATVAPESGHHARSWRDIRKIIAESGLEESDKTHSLAIFEDLATAEATVHGVPVDDVHFHEVGALDTIVDIVGVVVGLRLLGIERIHSGPIHTGGGTVRAAHGVMPVPAPATARLLAMHAIPVAQPHEGEDVAGELLTPTGAAILGSLASFTKPAFAPRSVGHGFGSKQFAWANMVRITIAETSEAHQVDTVEHLEVLETNIDDMNPQFLEILLERLFKAGARDAWTTPIQMKKQRSAICLSVLALPADRSRLASLIIENSTTLGVRVTSVDRIAADRRFESVGTRWGDVAVKLKIWNGRVIDISPEYGDCAAIARQHDIDIRAVWNEAYRIGEVYVGRKAERSDRLTVVDPIQGLVQTPSDGS